MPYSASTAYLKVRTSPRSNFWNAPIVPRLCELYLGTSSKMIFNPAAPGASPFLKASAICPFTFLIAGSLSDLSFTVSYPSWAMKDVMTFTT